MKKKVFKIVVLLETDGYDGSKGRILIFVVRLLTTLEPLKKLVDKKCFEDEMINQLTISPG